MIRLECKDGEHYKFWEAEVEGSSLVVHFGRIGTAGQTRDKKLKTPAAAQAELDKVMRDKLSHGYVKAGGKSQKPAPATKKTVSANAPLLVLAELMAPGHAKTKARVSLALSDPEAYKEKYLEDLEDRNAEDDPVDPFLALVIALTHEDVELATGLDWKESADEIHASLEGVIARQKKLRKSAPPFNAKNVLAFYDEDEHLETRTDKFIALCGKALAAHGLALVELDIASDSFELTVIPFAELANAKALAAKAGGGIIPHAPKTPLKVALRKAHRKQS